MTVNGTFTQRGSLRVITNPALWASITVDGVPRDAWGLWTDIPVGNREVCFGAVADFTRRLPARTPTCRAGQLTTITGDYVANPGAPGETGKGYLRVHHQPGACPSQVLVDGVIRDSWGLNWLKLNPGTYTLSFTHVEGYSRAGTPAGHDHRRPDDDRRRHLHPARIKLRVLTNPAVWGTISVDGVPRDDWGMWTDVPIGNHQVCFGPVQGFTTPPCQNANVTAGQTTTITGTYS